MKTPARLIATILALGVASVRAQNPAPVHEFTLPATGTANADGYYPSCNLVESGGVLYGTTESGGQYGYGVIFSVQTNGSGFTLVHVFTGGSDGGGPQKDQLLDGNVLYGTVVRGTN